jgi:hypothetical protein
MRGRDRRLADQARSTADARAAVIELQAQVEDLRGIVDEVVALLEPKPTREPTEVMTTSPPSTHAERVAELREHMRIVRERNAVRRERVLQRVENLGRIAEELRALARKR